MPLDFFRPLVEVSPKAVGAAADPVMMPWVIPQGTHFFNRPLVIDDMDGVVWRGYSSSKVSRLVYTGPPTVPIITAPAAWEIRSHGVKHQRINEDGTRTNKPIVVNKALGVQ